MIKDNGAWKVVALYNEMDEEEEEYKKEITIMYERFFGITSICGIMYMIVWQMVVLVGRFIKGWKMVDESITWRYANEE